MTAEAAAGTSPVLETGTPIRWRVTVFLAIVAAVNFADRSAFNAVMAPLQSALHLSDTGLGLLGSLFLWSYALASPLAGNLADRCSRSTLIAWSLGLWSLCTLLTGMANAFALLCVLRLGLGLSESAFSPAAFALVADHHGAATRGRAMSVLSLAFQVGIVAGAASAGFLAERYGWRAGFLCLGGLGVGLAFAAKVFISDRPRTAAAGASVSRPHPGRAGGAEAFRYLLGVPCFHLVMLKQFLTEMNTWILLTWIPLFLYESFHLTLGKAGFVGTLMLSGAIAVGMPLGGVISDFVGANNPRRRMLLLALYYFAAAPFPLVFLLHPTFPAVVAAVTACSLIRGIAVCSERPILCDVIPAPYRSTVFGFYNSIANVGGGAGVLLTGILKHGFGLHAVFGMLSAVFFIGALVILLAYAVYMPRDMARARAHPSSP